MAYDVAILIGSLRKESWSRKLAKALIAMAPPALDFRIVEFADVPLFNQDEEGEKASPAAKAFKAEIKKADALLFVTPEYNRSVPGVLKNAIDVASRPYGQSAFDGKPAAIISNSPGALAAFGANHHLRQSLVFLNMPVLQQPEMYLGGINKLLDEAGAFAADDTKKLAEKFLAAFVDWLARHAPAAEAQKRSA